MSDHTALRPVALGVRVALQRAESVDAVRAAIHLRGLLSATAAAARGVRCAAVHAVPRALVDRLQEAATGALPRPPTPGRRRQR